MFLLLQEIEYCIYVAYREWINLPRFEIFNFLISSQSVSFINLLNWKHNIYETRFSKNIFVLYGLWIWNIGMSLTPYQTKDKKGKPRIRLMTPIKSEQNRELTFGVIKMEWKKKCLLDCSSSRVCFRKWKLRLREKMTQLKRVVMKINVWSMVLLIDWLIDLSNQFLGTLKKYLHYL